MLPVEEVVDDVRAALRDTGHAVLTAPPGAGKTTIIPLRLLDEPWLEGRRIVVLEPRRLATRAAARRMASLLGEDVGGRVGYRTRDEVRVSTATRIEVVTEGILTRRLQRDPSLDGIGLVVFDELHERNLHSDLALALLLDARPLRPDLRLLAMSATLDAQRVAVLLGRDGDPAPVVVSEGRMHPVDVRWIPRKPRQRVADATAAAAVRALREEAGDILVFLPGAADIRRVERDLAGAGADVRPLFGALRAEDQDLALAPSPPGRRRVVLATDIAETSLTVEGVRVVVDSGESRTPRYDPASGLTRLRTGAISRASADQRAGRAGRTEPGVAYRLWSKLEHGTRRPYADPEILSVDLAGLALELAVWGAQPTGLAFLDPPPARALDEAHALLTMLGALDRDRRPTADGVAMAELGLHPRLARMVATSAAGPDGWTACLVAALLEDRDVLRGRPDEVPVDVVERLVLLDDPGRRHPLADGGALAGARRRAADIARRAGIATGDSDLFAAGRVLALAYPDRIAQSRGNGRFRLRTGTGAWVPSKEPLGNADFLVAADLDAGKRDARVRLAAALDAEDVELAAGADVTRHDLLEWDPARDDLRARWERRLDGLVLSAGEGPAAPGVATERALVERVRATKLAVLPWSEAARALQARFVVARRVLGDEWPDVSGVALLATLDEWLPPLLTGATGRADLARIDVVRVLRTRLGRQASELDRLLPTTVTLPGGRRVAVDYAGEQPSIAVRVQDAFGTTTHPTIGDGKVPLAVHLLSPAGRPVQVTSDLPGFWSGSWAEVRKEMAGRYPKHAWPENPTAKD